MDCNVTTALYLVTISTKLLPKATPHQEHSIYRHVFKLNRLDVRTKEGSSLLHLAASVDTPVDEFHTVDVCRYKQPIGFIVTKIYNSIDLFDGYTDFLVRPHANY